MTQYQTEQAKLCNVPTTSYAPIVQSFAAMDASVQE